MEQQMAELVQQMQQLTAENRRLSDTVGQLQQQAAVHAANQQAAQAVAHALGGLPQQLAQAIGNRPAQGRRSLVDVRGLGKPPAFQNDEKTFVTWARKVENYASSVYPELRQILPHVCEQERDEHVDPESLAAEPDLDADDVDLLTEMNEQMHVILSSLTDGETFDIVMGSGRGRGYEAWRRIHRRWDPLTTGRARCC